MAFIVTEKAKRPASDRNECFYCKQAIGAEHNTDCVLIQRKVKIDFIIELEVEVPAHWDEDHIDFHYNESTFCASNLLAKVEELEKEGCLCGKSSIEVAELEDLVELNER